MTSEVSVKESEAGYMGTLRFAAMIAVGGGAVGSTGFFLRAGRNTPRLLLLLLAIWVFSPFVGLLVASVASKRRSVPTRTTLCCVMLVVAFGSLAVYGIDAMSSPHAQAAFVYVIVPPASWLLLAIVVPIAALISRRRSGRDEEAR